jgi:hypothetical protein
MFRCGIASIRIKFEPRPSHRARGLRPMPEVMAFGADRSSLRLRLRAPLATLGWWVGDLLFLSPYHTGLAVKSCTRQRACGLRPCLHS